VVEFRVAGAAGQDSTYGSYRARGQRGGADAARRALALDPVCAEGVAPASAAGATGAACEAWDVAWVARPEGWYLPPPSLLLPLPMSLLYTPSVPWESGAASKVLLDPATALQATLSRASCAAQAFVPARLSASAPQSRSHACILRALTPPLLFP
jgi:hypothetical protein